MSCPSRPWRHARRTARTACQRHRAPICLKGRGPGRHCRLSTPRSDAGGNKHLILVRIGGSLELRCEAPQLVQGFLHPLLALFLLLGQAAAAKRQKAGRRFRRVRRASGAARASRLSAHQLSAWQVDRQKRRQQPYHGHNNFFFGKLMRPRIGVSQALGVGRWGWGQVETGELAIVRRAGDP